MPHRPVLGLPKHDVQKASLLSLLFLISAPRTLAAVVTVVDISTRIAGAPDDTAWLLLKPKLCLDNPWEKEWLTYHTTPSGKPAVYPHSQEAQILMDYFAREGITIWEIRQKKSPGPAPCRECGCDRGDTLSLRVSASDIGRLKELGYDRVIPDQLLTPKKR